jgi:hypothetical protein
MVLGGSGTFTDPYHSITKGIAEAEGGGRVFLRGGQYVECVDLAGVAGKWWRRIVVRPHKNERVTIDCLIPEFLQPGLDAQWEPVSDGGRDEYSWTRPFDQTGKDPLTGSVTKGAFLDRDPYTRLVTHDRTCGRRINFGQRICRRAIGSGSRSSLRAIAVVNR